MKMSGAKLKVLVTLVWVAFFAIAAWAGYIYTEKYVDGKYDEMSHGRMEVEYPVVLRITDDDAENTLELVLQPHSEYRQDRGNVLFVINGMGVDTSDTMKYEYEVVMDTDDSIKYHIHAYDPKTGAPKDFDEFCILRNGILMSPGIENATLAWTDERDSVETAEASLWEKIATVYITQPPEDTRKIFCVARYEVANDKSVYMMASGFDVLFVTYHCGYSRYTRGTNGRLVFNETLSNPDVEVYSVRMGVEPYTVLTPMTFYFYRNGTTRATYGILNESTGETNVEDCRILCMSRYGFFELVDSCDKDQSTQQPVYVPRSSPPISSPTASPEPTCDVVRDMTDDLGKSVKDEIGELGDDLHVDLSDFSDIVDKIRDSG